MATLPSFSTFSAGSILTAAQLNTNVRDAGNFFLSWPVAELRQTVAQSFTSGTAAMITFDTEDIDTDNGHSTSSNTSRYTPATAGRFQVSGAASWASNATGQRAAEWAKNGTTINGAGTSFAAISGATSRYPARTISLFANGSTDYFELSGFQNSGGALSTTVSLAVEQSTFSVRMVGTT